MPGPDPASLAAFAAALLGAGFAAGFLGGLVGAGGGLIVVPVLYHVFAALGVEPQVRMHLVVGTALAAVVPMSLLGARAHWARGNVDAGIVRKLALPVLAGAVVAGTLSGKVGGRELGLVFAAVAALVCANLLSRKGLELGQHLPNLLGTSVLGAAIGSVSTLVGIGGATLAVPVLHAFRTPMPIAIGTASTLGALIGLPGALAFMASGWGDPRVPAGSIGYVNLAAVALIFPASALAIPQGARFTRRVDERLLRAIFAAFLALTALRMLLAAR